MLAGTTVRNLTEATYCETLHLITGTLAGDGCQWSGALVRCAKRHELSDYWFSEPISAPNFGYLGDWRKSRVERPPG
jgi:hypothetical protein